MTKGSIIMLGATGAVGSHTVQTLVTITQIKRLTLLGRRPLSNMSSKVVHQHNIDIFNVESYRPLLSGYQSAICTLGVGQPSKMSKDDFVKIDKLAVLDFASACKKAGVRHFQLLASVGIDANSSSFYLRIKGELVNELKALGFERLSIFQPSMILTPTNRYGLAQAITLFVWPRLKPILLGGLRKYRGISVEQLGRAIAINTLNDNQGINNKAGVEMLFWDDFIELTETI